MLEMCMTEQLLTVPEVAERLRVTTMTIYRWIEEGRLPAMQIGKHYRIREADLDEVIESSVRTGTPEAWGEEPRRSPEVE
jgi:excisionase family DNA binding protein